MSVKYRVVTTTGKDKGKTSASVFIQIYGDKGETPKLKLEKFSNGDRDTIVEGKDVGIVQRIRVSHDNSGFTPGFFLEKVVVINTKTGAQSDFVCNRFLSTKEDDGQIARDIFSTKENAALVGYKIAVYTGSVQGAGTNANVYITLFGNLGDSGERNLVSTGKDCFERGHTDIFHVECIDVGALTRIKIGHDNKGVGAAWFLDKVVISNEKRGSWTFSCNKWFDKAEGDGLIVRDVPVDTIAAQTATSYSVTMTTGNLRGAGTTSRVSLEM